MSDLRSAAGRGWARARLMAHTVHDLGLRTIGQVAAHSLRRQRAHRAELAARAPQAAACPPGMLQTAAPIDGGARFTFDDAALEVLFLADDVVRLSWMPGRAPVPYAPVDELPWPAPTPALHGGDAGAPHRVTTGRLSVEVAADGSLAVADGDVVVRRDPPPLRRHGSWEHRFHTRSGERLCGLGEQSAGIDLRGGRFRLWNRDPGGAWGAGTRPLYVNIPLILATHPEGGWLCFYENSHRADVDLPAHGDQDSAASVRFADGMLRQYVTVGDPPAVLRRYSELTGRPALPPRWALGYHQSRWGYKRARDVEAVLDGYRREGIPLSAVHLDIDYMRGYRVFTVDADRFPDLGGLAGRAAEQSVRLVTIVDPAVKVDQGFELYRSGERDGRFCRSPNGRTEIGVVWPGRAAFPDFTDPETRRWWAARYRLLTDAGVAGMWHDMNEPTSISLLGDPTLPLATRHHLDGHGGDHAEAHNLYGLLMNRAGWEGLRAAYPERRPFIVSRSGWAGMQRHAWNWTGDVETSWAGLRQQVATVVGLGLSGVPYSGPDIGGFSGVPDPELYLRWLQMAVFLPFCRTHSVVGAPPREPWRFAEPTRATIVAWLRLRYRLLPYLYTLAHEAADTGAPLVRPLWWCDGGALDAARRGDASDDVFCLGDALVVAPVTSPGAERRPVPLPAGHFVEWWTGAPVAGPGEAELAAPAGRIPVLARAGHIVALDDGWARAGDPCALPADGLVADAGSGSGAPSPGHEPRLLAYHCWPAADGSAAGRCRDDVGDGDGPVRTDTVTLAGAVTGGQAVVRWERAGDYGAPARVRVVVHGWRAERVTADGAEVAGPGPAAAVVGPFDELRFEGMSPSAVD
jgi:alpha-glucosidase